MLSIFFPFLASPIFISHSLYLSPLPTLELHLYISSPLTLNPTPLYSPLLTLCLLHTSPNYSNCSSTTIPPQTPSHFPNWSLTLLLFSSSLSSLIFLSLQSLFYITPILLFLSTLFSPLCHIKRQRWCSTVVVFDCIRVLVFEWFSQGWPEPSSQTSELWTLIPEQPNIKDLIRACKWLMVAASSCV